MSDEVRRCSNCVYWLGGEDDIGKCCAKIPAWVEDNISLRQSVDWPQVGASYGEYCDAFEAA